MLKTVSSVTNAIGALNYKGVWNASSNSPTLTSGTGTKGDYYVVGTAGSTNLDGISVWSVGDWAVFNGTVWQKVDGGTSETYINLTVTNTANIATANVTNLVSSNVTITGGTVNGVTYNNVTINSGNATFTNFTTTNAVANSYQFSASAVMTETTTARTLSASDNGKIIYCTNTSPITVTTASGLGVGFSATIFQGNTGNVTIAAGSGTTLGSYSGQYVSQGNNARIMVFSPTSNNFVVSGDIGSALLLE
jgi:hypothetical protein